MKAVYICDYIRTSIGRYGGALAAVRTDDLAAIPIKALIERNKSVNWARLDEVILGCANQAGEDNRNVARMASLLAGLPADVPAMTLNRLCASGMDAIMTAARAIRAGESELILAGGVESMSRAPFVLPKAEAAYARSCEVYDTTIGWRFINPVLKALYGIDSMPETAENVAGEYAISREDQDAFAYRSQMKAETAIKKGRLAQEIVPLNVPQRKGEPVSVLRDEHPRTTTLEALAKLPAPFREGGTVTAGNASGVNDGAAALLLASEDAVTAHHLTPLARVLGGASAGVLPRIMGIGPLPATSKLLARLALTMDDFDVVELNEAFAAQALACLRAWDLDDNDPRVNMNGGAIALGHPLGMSGARITGSAALELGVSGNKRALCTLCVGVGQGVAVALETPS